MVAELLKHLNAVNADGTRLIDNTSVVLEIHIVKTNIFVYCVSVIECRHI